MIETDVCILGGGPAGATTALYLDKMGVQSVIIDKDTFPRHKTCGEAMRVNVHYVLKDLDPTYLDEVHQKNIILQSRQVRAIATNGKSLSINLGNSFCYMGKRYDFDNFLITKIKSKSNIQLIENQLIDVVTKVKDGYLLTDKSSDFQVKTKLVILATGGKNTLQAQLETEKKSTDNQILGVRAYFKNAQFSDTTTHIFFFKELYGGYMWVFPLPDGKANIGLAMKAEKIKTKKVNLRKTFEKLIEHERLQPFLQSASMESLISGAKVTLPTMGQSLSGDGYMLVGDTGLAINPITGMGVGHAMMMGRYAAQQVQRCLSANDFSVAMMKQYDTVIYEELGKEVEGGLWLTGLLSKTWLVNGMIRFFGSSQRFRKLFQNPALSDNIDNPVYLFKQLLYSPKK